MKVRFKKLSKNAQTPRYAKPGDACFDLTAISLRLTDKYVEYGTGIAIEIPQDHVGLIFPRSSVTNRDLLLKNSVGVIDSGYRGEVKFRFSNISVNKTTSEIYTIGERIGQMMILPIPSIDLEEVEELSETQRGEGGYGSSGD